MTKKLKGVILVILLILIFPMVQASELYSINYHSLQHITSADEIITINEDYLYGEFEGNIKIDNVTEILNPIKFRFKPIQSQEKLINLTYSIVLEDQISSNRVNKDINYSKGLAEFSINLENITGHQFVNVQINYTLEGHLLSVGNEKYRYHYRSQTDSNNKVLTLRIPNKYELIQSFEDAEIKPTQDYTQFIIPISGIYESSNIYWHYFILVDQEVVELNELAKNGIFTIIGALIGLILTIGWEIHKREENRRIFSKHLEKCNKQINYHISKLLQQILMMSYGYRYGSKIDLHMPKQRLYTKLEEIAGKNFDPTSKLNKKNVNTVEQLILELHELDSALDSYNSQNISILNPKEISLITSLSNRITRSKKIITDFKFQFSGRLNEGTIHNENKKMAEEIYKFLKSQGKI